MSLYADLQTITQPTKSTKLKYRKKYTIQSHPPFNTSTAQGQCSLTRKSAKQRIHARNLYSTRNNINIVKSSDKSTPTNELIHNTIQLINDSKHYDRVHKYDTRKQRHTAQYALDNQCQHNHLHCPACTALHKQSHNHIHDLCQLCQYNYQQQNDNSKTQYKPYNITALLLDRHSNTLTKPRHYRFDSYTDTPILQPSTAAAPLYTQISVTNNNNSEQFSQHGTDITTTQSDNINNSVRITDHLSEPYRHNPYKRNKVIPNHSTISINKSIHGDMNELYKLSYDDVQKQSVSNPELLYKSCSLPNHSHLGLYYPALAAGSIYTTDTNILSGVESTGEQVRFDIPVNMYNKSIDNKRPRCDILDSYTDSGNITKYGKSLGITRLKKHTGKSNNKYNRQNVYTEHDCECGGC